jgi:hypothetical protein
LYRYLPFSPLRRFLERANPVKQGAFCLLGIAVDILSGERLPANFDSEKKEPQIFLN